MPDQSLQNYSKVRQTALNIFFKMDKLAGEYTRHKRIKAIFDRIVKPKAVRNITQVIPEARLREILKDCYFELKPIFEEIQEADQIIAARKLNDPKIQKAVESLPNAKEILQLMEEM